LDKTIVYYTNNLVQERIAIKVRELIKKANLPIVAVSQFPIDFGYTILYPFNSSILTMFKQQLVGFESAKDGWIFCCEHDVLYHKSHFDFEPKDNKTYYYNTNVWTLNSKTGDLIWHNDKNTMGRMMTSGLVAHRDLLIEHYSKKIELVEKEGFSRRKHGYRPGKKAIDNYPTECYRSDAPNIDIKQEYNITKGRWSPEKFRNPKQVRKSWMMVDHLTAWGKTKGRFEEFLREL